MHKVQEARDAVLSAEVNLRIAREALDEALKKPSAAAQYLLDHFSTYEPTIKHDYPNEIAIHIGNWTHDRHGFRAQATCGNFLREHGFYLGYVVSNDAYKLELTFFHT